MNLYLVIIHIDDHILMDNQTTLVISLGMGLNETLTTHLNTS